MTARNGFRCGRSPFLALLTAVCSVAFLLFAERAVAQTVWDGPPLSFEKLDGADPNLPASQDTILPNVRLTRASSRGLYNIAVEAFFTRGTSPIDTEWAWTFNNPGIPESEIRASNFAALQFDEWTTAHAAQPLSTLGRPAVLHILSQDVYIDLTMTAWTSGPGGGFAYIRSTPPLPPAVPTLGSLGQALGTIVLSIWVGLSNQKGALSRWHPDSAAASEAFMARPRG